MKNVVLDKGIVRVGECVQCTVISVVEHVGEQFVLIMVGHVIGWARPSTIENYRVDTCGKKK